MNKLFNVLKKIFFKLFPWIVIIPGVMIILYSHMSFVPSILLSMTMGAAVAVLETIIKNRKIS